MPQERRLLPIVLAYLPVPVLGAALSLRWGVGATPDGGPGDMILRGTALTPPLFLPAALLGAALAARSPGSAGRAGAAVASVVGTAFLAGSTLNLPTDVAAARSAGTPVPLTLTLAAVHAVLGLTLLACGLGRAIRGGSAADQAWVSGSPTGSSASSAAGRRRSPSRGRP